ncbi:MAG TPA: FlgD immunoglobulin-like domain containing protein, partial [bacterium]|nr:FlgD immunoglobulin-like domain containing protein [bacterium]
IGLYPDSTVISSAPVTFRWYPATDPDINDHILYRVMISERADFSGSNYITRTTDMSTNQLTLDRKLMENRKYYWRVKSIDMHGAESDWSQRHCFYINFINEAPDRPVEYLSPENWSELNSSTVFRWKLAHDPDPGEELDYILEIDNDKYFQSTDLNHRITSQNLVIDQENQTAIFDFGQIDSTGLEENELYYWRIAAIDQKGLKSPFYRNYPRLNYNTQNDPPEPVQQYTNIKSGGMVNTQTPLLRWKAARDPDFMDFGRTLHYTLQVSRSPDFSTYDLFSYQSKKGANSVKITKTLDENKKWFFRIQTVDSKGATSEWSEVDSFVVNAKSEAPQQVNKGFVLRNNMTTDTQEPKLSWRPVDDKDPHHKPDDIYYLVKYCPSRYFGTRKENKNSETIKSRAGRTSVVLPELDENKSYCYRVAAVDPEGKHSEWSDPQQFIVNSNQEAPRPFALISPANGSDSVTTDISFKWRRSSDPDPQSSLEYSIMISTDSLFRRAVIENRIASPEGDTIKYIPASPLKSASKYFWKVIAEDNTGLATSMPPGENNSYMFTTIGFKEYLNVGKKSRLLQNSPNPFHNVTRISYYVGSFTNVRIMVFNVLGEKVDVMVNKKMKAGQYEVTWDGTNQDGQPMPGGMYFCRMATPRNNDLIKMIMLR